MKRRNILGLLLAAVLTVTCIPTVAFADEGEKASGSTLVEESYVIETEAVEQEEPESTEPIVEDEEGEDAAVEGEETVAEDAVVEDEDAADETEEAPVMLMSEIEEDGINTYKVYLPSDYDESKSYPTVYLMPYDGYESDIYVADGIQARLDELMASNDVLSMVVVMPDFDEDDDYSTLLDAIVADVEGKYAVIKDAKYRAILGANVGGYMAMETAVIAKNKGFYAVGSHMGDFTSDENPYLAKGSVLEAVNNMGALNNAFMPVPKDHYYYIDGPNGDSFTTVPGGTTDIGASLEKRTNPYWVYGASVYSTPDTSIVEYAILDGEGDASFYLKSMGRSLNRFSQRFTENLYSASLTCTPQAVKSTDETVIATVKFTLNSAVSMFTTEVPEVELTLDMIDPANGDVLYTTSAVLEGLELGTEKVHSFTLDTDNMADGVNTTVSASAKFLDMNQPLASVSLVSIQDTGTAPDEQQIDLMGDWYFKAYKSYKANDTSVVELDKVENIVPKTYENWGIVQPGLAWWTDDFDSSLNGQGQFGGYAWYVRTFDLPTDFPTEDLILGVGKFDEANEVYINGKYVGSSGMRYDIAEGIGVYDGSNPWDVNCMYDLDSSILNYGGENTIAVRMCNESGGGGWYEGPIGVYSIAAYNKAYGKPSTYAPDDVKSAVLALAQTQQEAIESENLEAYKDTLSVDYFESGYDKERRVEEVKGWMDSYSDIQITDSSVGVFVDGDLYNYQAVRKITGKDANGTESTIFEGEVSEYYAMSNGKAIMYGSHSRFFEDTYTSAALSGQKVSYRMYLPEGYFDVDNVKRYPTMVLLHGINSSSNAYAIDKIDKVLDEAIANGEIRETIVVIPDDPTKSSFWSGNYESMVKDDLLSIVDDAYRTIDDARYRYTAGCSMGGGGAMNIGLFNPDVFSGVISFYGALNYVGATTKASALPDEYFDQYTIYMASGNQDMYDFYDVQEQMSRILSSKNAEHYHYVDNGKHDTAFYLPLFIDAVKYIEAGAYTTGGTAADTVTGTAAVEEKENAITVSYDVDASKVLNAYAGIQIPVQVRVLQNGVVVADVTEYYAVEDAAQLTNSVEVSAEDFDITKEYTVEVYTSVLEDTKLLASKVMHEDVIDPGTPGGPSAPADPTPGTGNKPGTGTASKNDTVDTGDHAPITLYLGLAMAAVVAMVVAVRIRRRA